MESHRRLDQTESADSAMDRSPDDEPTSGKACPHPPLQGLCAGAATGRVMVLADIPQALNRIDFGRAIRIVRGSLEHLPAPQAASAPRGPTMAKPAQIKIRLNSTADTGYFYVTKKNARTKTEKLVFKKYDPIARKHVEFREGKIK